MGPGVTKPWRLPEVKELRATTSTVRVYESTGTEVHQGAHDALLKCHITMHVESAPTWLELHKEKVVEVVSSMETLPLMVAVLKEKRDSTMTACVRPRFGQQAGCLHEVRQALRFQDGLPWFNTLGSIARWRTIVLTQFSRVKFCHKKRIQLEEIKVQWR